MFTRKQYLNRECSHADYYAQFVGEDIKHSVLHTIGRDKIMASSDPHFNDIPLAFWDSIIGLVPHQIATKMRELGDYPTLAGNVCIAKEAARQIKEAA